MAKLKETETRLQLRVQEAQRRENVLNMRLATKQQETQEIMVGAGGRGGCMVVLSTGYHSVCVLSVLSVPWGALAGLPGGSDFSA